VKYYPLYLNLKAHPVLLIGGGAVALQKIPALLSCEAAVHLIAPEALPEIAQLAAEEKIHWERRSYETRDLEGVRLVIAATDDPALQERVAAEARARNLWVNVVDVPPLCDFIAPALVSRGDLQIAISTGGGSPALAKYLRKKLDAFLAPEYEIFLSLLQKIRPEINHLAKERRAALWDRIVSDAFINQVKMEGPAKAEAQIRKWIDGTLSLQ
jgi:siroheme synthase-like protein